MSNLIGLDDLVRWSQWSTGSEKIGSALRPYGLHAGNLVSIVAYPYLLCEAFRGLRKEEPRFTYKVWLNDIEPLTYVGADGRKESANASNMYPGSTTLQFVPAPDGFQGSLTDYWQPVIEGVVRGTIGTRFPYVNLEFHRTSELVCTTEFQKAVLGSIDERKRVAEIFEKYQSKKVRGSKGFVWPICPKCHVPVTNVKVSKDRSSHTTMVYGSHGVLPNCRFREEVQKLDWAMNIRVLQVIRLAVEQPDLWFIGVDHLPVNRTYHLEGLGSMLGLDRYRGHFLHVPLLFADRENKLSKSRGNAVYMHPQELIQAFRYADGVGYDLRNAPTSKDIMALGEEMLPDHVKQNKEERLAALYQERKAYKRSSRRTLFEISIRGGGMSRAKVARIVGVPHL